MSKPVIECNVYLNSSYGKVTLAYSPVCEKGKKLLNYLASKEDSSKERTTFSATMFNQALTMVDIKVVGVPKLPTIPTLNSIVSSKVSLPDFLK